MVEPKNAGGQIDVELEELLAHSRSRLAAAGSTREQQHGDVGNGRKAVRSCRTLEELNELDELILAAAREEDERKRKRTAAIDYTGLRPQHDAFKATEDFSGGQDMSSRVGELISLKTQLENSFKDAMKKLDEKIESAKAAGDDDDAAEKSAVRSGIEAAGTVGGIAAARMFPRRPGEMKPR